MSLSAHLVDQYADRKPFLPPHLRPDFNRNPNPMQVKQDPEQSWYSNHGDTTANTNAGNRTSWSEEKLEQLQVRLARKLGPEYITQRPGPGGGPKLSYVEGWKVINLANEVFGFNGWSSSITQLTVDFLDVNKEGRCSVNITAIVRITLQDGCFHEDVGCGQGENIKSKGAALDKAKKEAVTDATKRALKTFGNVLGNCLYDKQYTAEVAKMRVPPPKFNQNELERRPEFAIQQPQPVPQAQPVQQQPQAGPSRPTATTAPLTNTGRPSAPVVPPAPPSPLRTLQEAEMNDITMTEAFDGEFLDMGGESFFDIVDQDGPSHDAGMRDKVLPPKMTVAEDQKPGYQHRTRPDAPAAPVTPATSEQKRPFTRVVSNDAAARARRMNAIMAADAASAPAETRSDGHRSSGSSTSINQDQGHGDGRPPPRSVGNIAQAVQAGPSRGTGTSARALAIQSAMQSIQTDTPRRPESPRIPDGGIDAVALKAGSSSNMRHYSAKLQLDEEITLVNTPGNGNGTGAGKGAAFDGFSSARGMKRTISNDIRDRQGSQSPTKGGGGQRAALGELPIDYGEEGGGGYKRTRS